MLETIKLLLETSRPGQWIKNLFVVAPVLFAKHSVWNHPFEYIKALLGFVVFVLLSSSVYIFNDLMDLKYDRQHPVKRHRPLASGRLSIPVAIGAGLVELSVAVGLGIYLSKWFLLMALLYLILNVAYSLKLKHIAYVDALTISIGFLLRILAGCFAVDLSVEEISYFLVLCTFFLSFYLALGKRRHELVLVSLGSGKHRPVLEDYNQKHLDVLLKVIGVITGLLYIYYTVAPRTVHYFGTWKLVFTTPFTIFGLYRFYQLLHRNDTAESPTDRMVKDVPFMLNLVLWLIVVLVVLYA